MFERKSEVRAREKQKVHRSPVSFLFLQRKREERQKGDRERFEKLTINHVVVEDNVKPVGGEKLGRPEEPGFNARCGDVVVASHRRSRRRGGVERRRDRTGR